MPPGLTNKELSIVNSALDLLDKLDKLCLEHKDALWELAHGDDLNVLALFAAQYDSGRKDSLLAEVQSLAYLLGYFRGKGLL